MVSQLGLAELIQLGHDIISFKLYATCLTALWAYDYFLTVGDEIRYAWRTENVPMFTLFLLIRYIPVPYLAWSGVLTWSLNNTFEVCKKTGFIGTVYSALMTAFAQVVLTQRTYAITRKNKWIAGILYIVVIVQFGLGVHMFVHAAAHPVMTLSTIPLDAFRLCFAEVGQTSVIAQVSLNLAFDVTVFVFVIAQARLFKLAHPGVNVPSILDAVSRDSRVYFAVISSSHTLTMVMYCVARPSLRAVVTVGNTVLVPMMMARMIISLKEVANSRQPDPDLEAPSGLTTNLQDRHFPQTADGIPLSVLRSGRKQNGSLRG